MLCILALVSTRLSQVITCTQSYIVDDEITVIGQNAFQDCTEILTSFSFKANPKLQIIEDYAFIQCTKLTSIDLSKCKYLTSIGNNAFSNCESVQTLNLPSNLQQIGKSAFGSCSNINSIDLSLLQNLRYIHESTFSSCLQLNELKFPINLEYIGFNAFSGTKLQNFKIPKSVSIITRFGIDNYALDSSQYLTQDGDFLYSQDKRILFIYNGTSQSVIIPDSVQFIQDYCFYKNENIKSVEFPDNLQRIGKNSFASCRNLERITIPATVTHIFENAFSGCIKLETCNFDSASQLESIGSYVFKDTKVSNLRLPKSIKNFSRLGSQNFIFETPSEYLIEKDGMIYSKDLSVAFIYKGSSDVFYLYQNTKIIQDYCFKDCQSITEFVSTGYLDYIGKEAFSNCAKLKSIRIECVNVLRDGALYGCNNLEVMNIRFKQIFNGEYPFDDYPKLKSIGDFKYGDYKAINDSLIFYSGDYSTLRLHAPKSNHNFLRSGSNFIRRSAFSGSENLETLVLNNVIKIYDNAFSGCPKLKDLYLSDKLVYFKKQADYNFQNIYVLNNDQAVINMLKQNGFNLASISSWELPPMTYDFNVNMIKHLGIDFAGSIVRSNFILLLLSSLSSLF